MSTNTLTRLVYVDILKIVATFSIIALHVSALYVHMDAALVHPSGALLYIVNALVRTALPLFMMISGALLLRDGYSFKFKQKFFFILKMVIVWSAFYTVCDQVFRLANGQPLLSPLELLAGWVRGPYHFWYLQMLLGFYLLMPLLARIKGLQTLNYATLLFFVILYVYNPLAGYLPACVQAVAGQLILFSPSAMLFFFLLGACLHRVPLRPKVAALAGLCVLVGLGLRFYLLFSTENYQASTMVQPFNSYSELLLAVGVFYLVRYFSRHAEGGPRMQYLSKCTLRIYVSSAFVIYLYQFFIQPHWDAHVPWPTLSVLVWSVVVFFCSWLIAHLLTKKDRALGAARAKRMSR